MPSVTTWTDSKGKLRHQGQVRLAREATISRSHDTELEAFQWAQGVEENLRAERKKKKSRIVPPPPGGDLANEPLSVTLAYFALPTTPATGTNRDRIPALLRTIGNVLLGDVNDHWAENYLEQMREEFPKNRTKRYAESTHKKALEAINAAIRWRARRLNVTLPCQRIDVKLLINKRHDVVRRRRLGKEESTRLWARLRKLRAKSGRQWRCLVRLAVATGARLDELCDIPWSEIDMKTRRWVLLAERTKSDEDRVIPLNPRARRVLALLDKERDPTSPRVFNKLGDMHSLSCRFWTLTRQAGVVDFRFHDFKHEAIVRFVTRATSVGQYTKIMKAVGHTDFTTFNRYITFTDEEMDGCLG